MTPGPALSKGWRAAAYRIVLFPLVLRFVQTRHLACAYPFLTLAGAVALGTPARRRGGAAAEP